MSDKLTIFLAHSGRPADLDLIEQARLRNYLRDMTPGAIELSDRQSFDENDLVDQLRGVKLIIHLISADYPGDDDELFYLQIVEAVQNFGIQTVPLLLFPRNEEAWLSRLYNNNKQVLLLDQPLANHPEGQLNAAFRFSEKLREVLPQVEAAAPALPNVPAVDPELLLRALQELDFTEQRAAIANEFSRAKHYHFVYLQGTPECGHSLLLRSLERTAGIYRDNARVERVNLSVDPALPADFTVWDRLAGHVLDPVALKYIKAEDRKPATIDRFVEELSAGEDRNLLYYLVFDNNRQATLDKLRRFWEEFNTALPAQPPAGRLFFFAVDRCGGGPEPALTPAELGRQLHPAAGALPLPPIAPLRRTLVENWLFERFDYPLAKKLEETLHEQLDKLVNTYRYIKTFILKLCELLFRKDVYQKLFGDETI